MSEQPVKLSYVLPHKRHMQSQQKPTTVDITSIHDFPTLSVARQEQQEQQEHKQTTSLNFKTMLDESARKAEVERKRQLVYQKGSHETMRRLGWEILKIKPFQVLSERLYRREHDLPLEDPEQFKDMEGYIPGLIVQRYDDLNYTDQSTSLNVEEDMEMHMDLNLDHFVDTVLYDHDTF